MIATLRQRLLVAVTALAGAACQQYPFTFQVNQRVDARNYQVQVASEGATDILFIIDNSPSMLEAKQNLQANVAAFIGTLTDSVVDYQVGVITPDMVRVPANDGTCTPCCDLDTDGDGIPDYTNCDGGRLASFDGRTRVLKRPVSDDPAVVASQTQTLIDNFNSTVNSIGTNGDAYERSFQAMQSALGQTEDQSPFAIRAANFGFLRPTADLAVIIMSDEDECSNADLSWYTDVGRDDADCYVTPDLEAVSDFVDFLQSLKGGDIRRIRAAAIVGTVKDVGAPLGFSAEGCITGNDGNESDQCGCFADRFYPDRSTPAPGDDLFCNLLAAPPYNQLPTRTPALPDNQGGCQKLPGSRYVAFLEEIARRHLALGDKPGVVVDSLCKADYGPTLKDIAISIVINNCFLLVEPPDSDFQDNIILLRNGQPLPRVDAGSKTQGYSYDPDKNQVCLEGGLIKSVNDTYDIEVVSAVKGFDDGGNASAP